jgi:hypothetical protein
MRRNRLTQVLSRCWQRFFGVQHLPLGRTSLRGARHWLALASDGWRVERVMGIENTALESISISNQCVTSLVERCVRFLCEKQRYTGQR